jgi:hypothetical protein
LATKGLDVKFHGAILPDKPELLSWREERDERGRDFSDEKSGVDVVTSDELFKEEKVRHRSSNPAPN